MFNKNVSRETFLIWLKNRGEKMELNIYQVDAFTESTFGGNPAGVVPDARNLTDVDMQNIAREMNLSETAFIEELDKENFKVRFFTPRCEVDLCGHATIASFYLLAQKQYIMPIDNGIRKLYQETKAGRLSVEIYYKNCQVDKVLMEQGEPKSLGRIESIKPILESFRIGEEDLGIGEKFIYPEIISTGLPDIILPIKNKDILYNLSVDFEKLEKVSKKLNVIGVHAFYLPNDDSDVVYTRNFAPAVGINEEAATGTSNGALIYYLKKNGLLEKDEIISIQGETMNRPSAIYCSIENINNKYIVKVGGKSKIVMEAIVNV
ncbi:MAG: Phenazine biosynthesis protein PhzF family [Sporanaerobacter sp.]|jgi:PhzF family phenazine biosynthesis protein